LSENIFETEKSYRQAIKGVINYYFLCVKQKKIFCKFLFSNHKVVFAHFDLLNIKVARVFAQRLTLSAIIFGKNKDIDNW